MTEINKRVFRGYLTLYGLLSTYFFSIQASIFGALSFGDLLNRVFLFPSYKILDNLTNIGPLFIILTVLGITLLYYNRKKTPIDFFLLLISSVVIHSIIYSYLYTKGAALELFSERYFRLSSILFIPFFLSIIYSLNSKYLKFAFFILFSFFSFYGLSSYYIKVKACFNSEKSIHGYSLAGYSKNLIDILHKCDKVQKENKVIAIGVLSLSNEFKQSKPLYLLTDCRDENWLKNQNYVCYSENIYLFLKASEYSKNIAILNSFKEYQKNDWSFYQIDEEWRLYHQKKQNIDFIIN